MMVAFCCHLLVVFLCCCCFPAISTIVVCCAFSTTVHPRSSLSTKNNVFWQRKDTHSSTQRQVRMIQRASPSTSAETMRTPSTSISSPMSSNKDNKDDKEQQEYYIPQQTNPRPLHQNWWPVSALYALQKDRPNALMVLEKPLVAVYDSSSPGKSSDCWNVLDDRCSHRFAPLSEGRIVMSDSATNSTCIQCAYHGWEFEASSGVCHKVPQEPNHQRNNKARPVQTYPTRVKAGMLWVWTDPDTAETLAPSIPLPINPLLREHVARRGMNSCFMRDLPYGMEILGENLLDLSHLPFAHHSVGSLNRNIGGPLPTRMLSRAQRQENAQWEKKYDNNESVIVLPTFQAEILNASQHDPIFKAFSSPGSGPGPVGSSAGATPPKEDWTTTVAYYDPCHVRYRRWRGTGSHVELFMCPTSQGRSRVFLYNAMEQPPTEAAPAVTSSKSLRRRLGQVLAAFKPSTWKAVLFRRMLIKIQSGHLGHVFTHAIFDGDGIFLHKQGNRMKAAGLSYSDYSTPSSADILLNAYRRFVDTAAKVTRNRGDSGNANDESLVTMANAVVGTDNYGDDAPRSEMLDRYNTHTKFCPVCREALQRARQTKRRLGQLQTAIQGPTIAMTMAFVILTLVSSKTKAAPFPALLLAARSVWPMVTATAGVAWLVSWAVQRTDKKLDKTINSFIFEDYVHAEKN